MALTGSKDADWLIMNRLELWDIWNLASVNKHALRVYNDETYWRILMCNTHRRYLKRILGKEMTDIPVLPDGYTWKLFYKEVFHFAALSTKTNFKRRNPIGYALRNNKLGLIDYFLTVNIPVNPDCFKAAAETGKESIVEYVCQLYEEQHKDSDKFAVDTHIAQILEGFVLGNHLELFERFYEAWALGLDMGEKTHLTELIAASPNPGFWEYYAEEEENYSKIVWIRGRMSGNHTVNEKELHRYNWEHALHGTCLAGNIEMATFLLGKLDSVGFKGIRSSILPFIMKGLVQKIEREMGQGKFSGEVSSDPHIQLFENCLYGAMKEDRHIRGDLTAAYQILGKGAKREKILRSKSRKQYHSIFPNIEIVLNEDPRIIFAKSPLEKLGAGEFRYAMERAIVKRKWSNIHKWIEAGFDDWNFGASCVCFAIYLQRKATKCTAELDEYEKVIDFFLSKHVTNFYYLTVPDDVILKYVIDKYINEEMLDKAMRVLTKRMKLPLERKIALQMLETKKSILVENAQK